MIAAPAALAPRLDWSAFDDAVASAADAGFAPAFWWRDDDAVRHTPALDRLLALARGLRVHLALAAIPTRAEPSLSARLATEERTAVLVHGLAHVNHEPPGQKRAEFGPHRPRELAARDAAQALATALGAFGGRLAPVLVPPWNRLAPGLAEALPRLGYAGVSAFKDRPAPSPAPGLVQVNTHLDPVDWHGGRGLVDPAALIAKAGQAVRDRAAGRADRDEPIGLLTHHLAHHETVWAFCEAFLVRAAAYHGMRFLAAGVLFRPKGEDGALSAPRS